MSTIKKLVLDIETIGYDFDSFDKESQDNLTRWLKKESSSEKEYEKKMEGMKKELGLSPVTGEIASIGVLDVDEDKGAVWFQSPKEKIKEYTEGGIVYRSRNEKQMLAEFWKLSLQYDHFITFNGRQFDIPFLMLRSAMNQVRPSKDLMKNRYLNYQSADALHIDLLDQLSFYGALRRKGSLHMFLKAFKIESSKEGDISGENITEAFKDGKYKEIAEYNARDIFATRELYKYWDQYLRF